MPGSPVLCEKPAGLSRRRWRRRARRPTRPECPTRSPTGDASSPVGRRLRQRHARRGSRPPPAYRLRAMGRALRRHRQFRRPSGGIFVDMGVHEFDEVRWITGEDDRRRPGRGHDTRPRPERAARRRHTPGAAHLTLAHGRGLPRPAPPAGDLVPCEVFGSARFRATRRPRSGRRASARCSTRCACRRNPSPSSSDGRAPEGAGTKDAVAAIADAERGERLRRVARIVPIGRRKFFQSIDPRSGRA